MLYSKSLSESLSTSLPPAGLTQHHSLALEVLLKNLTEESKPRILDLGPANGANVSFLTRFRSKLFIADLFQTLRQQKQGMLWDAGVLDTALARHLPYRDEERFDLLFAWDLLNYLTPEEVAVLGHHLVRLCRPKGLLFAMIATRKTMPDLPITYSIVDLETLAYDNSTRALRDSPGYKEADLGRLLPAFEVETSFLLRNGMQEYVFARRAA